MEKSFRSLIDELSSPLFRIMWVANSEDPARRFFENNVSAFHIGNGFFLSVAHNLRSECSLIRSVPEIVFEEEWCSGLNPAQRDVLEEYYEPADRFSMRHLRPIQQTAAQSVSELIKSTGFDNRWISLTSKNISSPFLIIQFRSELFYNDTALTSQFDERLKFFEPALGRYTFLIPLVLKSIWYKNDVALYKAAGPDDSIINKIPAIGLDLSLVGMGSGPLYCLQSSPAGHIGRMVNTATLEGYLDHYQTFLDRIGGNYHLEGLRYLIRGYFRFGSSGAPYLVRNAHDENYSVNAIQSEASPVQLSINNNRDGNYQYVNAIASPLHSISGELINVTGSIA